MEPIISLPFLRGGVKNSPPYGVRLFNPGLSEKYTSSIAGVEYYSPVMPLAPKVTEAILEEMASIGRESPENLVNGLNRYSIREDMGFKQEMEELQAFTGKRDSCGKNPYFLLEFAQKILLWRWHTESLWEEIRSLERDIHRKEFRLQNIFEDYPLEELAEPERKGGDEQDIGWKKVIENAIFFLSENFDIFLEKTAAEDLPDSLEYIPVKKNGKLGFLGEGYLYARCPAWKILGNGTPGRFGFLQSYPALAANFLENRNWIMHESQL